MSNSVQPSLQAATAYVGAWWERQGLATRCYLAVCGVLYVLTLIDVLSVRGACSGGRILLQQFRVWRLLTAPFFHVGILHLVMNSLALIQLLPPLENEHGTSGALTVSAMYALLAQLIAVTPGALLHIAFGVSNGVFVETWTSCTVGLSGMLFGLLALEVSKDEVSLGVFKRNICGYPVPSKAYPWVLVLLVQVLSPMASWEVHVGGILAAYLLPPPSRLRAVVTRIDSNLPATVKGMVSFVPANRAPLPYSGDAGTSIQGGWAWAADNSNAGKKSFPGAGRALGVGEGEAGGGGGDVARLAVSSSPPAGAMRSSSTTITTPSQRSATPKAARVEPDESIV